MSNVIGWIQNAKPRKPDTTIEYDQQLRMWEVAGRLFKRKRDAKAYADKLNQAEEQADFGFWICDGCGFDVTAGECVCPTQMDISEAMSC